MKWMALVGACATLVTHVVAADDAAIEAHRRLEAEVRAAEARTAALRDGIDVLRSGAEVMTVAAELMTGARRELPPADAGESVVAVFEADSPKTFARAAGEKRKTLVMRSLDLEEGRTYRFEAEVSARGAKPAKGVRFGLRVQCPDGKVDWPSAAISKSDGETSFSWVKTRFSYKVPRGARPTILYGLSSQATGEASFRNVRIVRTAR